MSAPMEADDIWESDDSEYMSSDDYQDAKMEDIVGAAIGGIEDAVGAANFRADEYQPSVAHRRHFGNFNLIPLNLTARYANSWGGWEGIREFIQNWHDGIYDASDQQVKLHPTTKFQIVTFRLISESEFHTEYTAKVKVCTEVSDYGTLHYDKRNLRLTLINRKVSLQKKILLLGYSSKSKHRDVIGQFGEGLKIGALALVRQGREVTMETNRQRWKFALDKYEHFGGELGLVVIETLSERVLHAKHPDFVFPPCPVDLDVEDTSVSISPVTTEEFEMCRKRFLFLTPAKHYVETELGTLLLDEEFSGNLFVKGSFVVDLKDQDLVTGVDFSDVSLDRDRNAVQEMSEIDHKISCMWLRALGKTSLSKHRNLTERYYKLLVERPDCRDVRHAHKYIDDNSRVPKLMATEYARDHPEEYPVPDTYPKDRLPNLQEELGVLVFPCPEVLLNLLYRSGEYQTLEEARATRLHQEPQAEWAPGPELSPDQVRALHLATETAHIADPGIEADKIEIIYTPNEEKSPSYQEGKYIIPAWMLELESIHKHSQLCKQQGAKQKNCFCRQIRICNALLTLRKIETKSKPERHANEYPPESALITIMARVMQTEKRKPPYCVQIHQTGQVLDTSGVHAECTLKEEELRKQIKVKKLELMQSQKEHQEELARLNHECSTVRKDLMNNMVRDSVTDQQLDEVKEKYDKQLEDYKSQVEGQLTAKDRKIEEKEALLLNARRDLIHKQLMLTDQAQSMEQFARCKDHRHTTLVQKVTHYKEVLEKKAVEVKGRQSKNKKFSESLCREISAKCNEICSELEGQSYLCEKCKKEKKSHILFPCNHYKFCASCASQYIHRKCPVSRCRKTVTRTEKIYE